MQLLHAYLFNIALTCTAKELPKHMISFVDPTYLDDPIITCTANRLQAQNDQPPAKELSMLLSHLRGNAKPKINGLTSHDFSHLTADLINHHDILTCYRFI